MGRGTEPQVGLGTVLGNFMHQLALIIQKLLTIHVQLIKNSVQLCVIKLITNLIRDENRDRDLENKENYRDFIRISFCS